MALLLNFTVRKRKIENPLVDKMTRSTTNERIATFIAIALIVAGVSGAIISRVTCKDSNKPKTTPSLKICTPEEHVRVKQALRKGRQATSEEVKTVLSELDAILDMHLDCGWENVKDTHSKLSSRRQP